MKRKPEPAQLDDFLDDAIDAALTRLLAVGAPDRTERAMLRASAHGLHRRPHVAALRQQIPARGDELVAADPAAFVQRLRVARHAVGHDLLPDEVAVAADDRVRRAVLARFVRKQRGVNAAVHDPGAALPGDPSDLVAAQGVARVDADADDVAGDDRFGVQRLEGFVDDEGIAPGGPGRGGQHIQPARRDDRHAKRHVARIDQMYTRTQRHLIQSAGGR